MQKLLRLCCLSALCAVAIGCLSTRGNLQQETARYIDKNIAPEQIEVFDIQRTLKTVTWKAKTPDGNYECSSDDKAGGVYCSKR